MKHRSHVIKDRVGNYIGEIRDVVAVHFLISIPTSCEGEIAIFLLGEGLDVVHMYGQRSLVVKGGGGVGS